MQSLFTHIIFMYTLVELARIANKRCISKMQIVLLLSAEAKATILKPLHKLTTPSTCSRVYSILSRDLSTNYMAHCCPQQSGYRPYKQAYTDTCSLLGNWLDRKPFGLNTARFQGQAQHSRSGTIHKQLFLSWD